MGARHNGRPKTAAREVGCAIGRHRTVPSDPKVMNENSKHGRAIPAFSLYYTQEYLLPSRFIAVLRL